ncbi:MAG: phage tail protein [Sphingomonas sp.]|jgi:hypothetical protein
MASLILTAVGSAIAGPIGGAIGAIAGQAVDQRFLFKPKGRQGPRLTELAVQTSSYGAPIPKLFGTLRVAGTVIWSTDLIESRTKNGGAKGQPSVTTYSYSASFAVLLSARKIRGVRRIWADGKLLRGAAGDFKTATDFRLHLGEEEQAADPMIVAAEGAARAPAHRGYAYAVFENFQLADYGNRLPSLTFEVEADAAPVAVGAIAHEVSNGLVDGSEAALPLPGFSAYGDSVRGVLETLAEVGGAWFSPTGAGVAMRTGSGEARLVADGGYAGARGRRVRRSRMIAAIETVPQTVTVGHYDPARDYQAGLQRARRPGAGTRTERLDIPAALDGAMAKAVAEQALVRAEAARERRSVALSWSSLALAPGDVVALAGEAGRWRASGWSLEAMVLSLDLVRLGAGAASMAATSGRVLPAPDLLHGPTLVVAAELLPLDDGILPAPRLLVLAAGSEPGWRRAALLYSVDGGASYAAAGPTASPAVLGEVTRGAGQAGAALRDLVNTVEVTLAHQAMALADADDAGLDQGRNLALIGDELVQFGIADQTGPRTWRISRLLRARRGSAPGPLAAGARFVLIDRDTLVPIDVPLSALGSAVSVLASGVGDTAGPAQAVTLVSGASVRPPSPVHLRVENAGADAVMLRWARRSRAGWRWIDGADTPLVEERESYRVSLIGGASADSNVETSAPMLALSAQALAGRTAIEVRQCGANGESLPARHLL